MLVCVGWERRWECTTYVCMYVWEGVDHSKYIDDTYSDESIVTVQ